jgi:hypothetical protein
LLVILQCKPSPQNSLQIDASFPGGNIILEKISGDSVYVHQDIRETRGFWFYWYFGVYNAENCTLTFQFTGKNVMGARGPAISRDQGKTWQWLGTEVVKNNAFVYIFSGDEKNVRFSFGMPYVESHLNVFINRFQHHPHLKITDHCLTLEGRTTRRLFLGCIEKQPKYRIVVTARHHACEMMASYVLEGLVETILSDSELGNWFQNHVECLVIPFMDKDGVENGDQGKNRMPFDHNRDYDAKSIYPSVRGLRALVPKWSQNKLKMVLDLHCPYIKAGLSEVIYFPGNENPQIWQAQQEFGEILESSCSGPLKYYKSNNLPFGQGWLQKKPPFQKPCSAWGGELAGIGVSTTIEIPYATASGKEVNQTTARAFGRDLALAVSRFLQTSQTDKQESNP